MFKGHLLTSAYVGGHAEALEVGVSRIDIATDFKRRQQQLSSLFQNSNSA